MRKPGPTASRLAATFLLGCLLFSFPLIALFNVQGTVLGIPVLYAYLFAAWGLLIGLVALLLEKAD
jgi:predicted permease